MRESSGTERVQLLKAKINNNVSQQKKILTKVGWGSWIVKNEDDELKKKKKI